jgi:hypothetical protein
MSTWILIQYILGRRKAQGRDPLDSNAKRQTYILVSLNVLL